MLDPIQRQRVQQVARREKKSVSRIIGEALDQFLLGKKPARNGRKDPLDAIVGVIRDGGKHLGRDHDEIYKGKA